MSTTTSTTSSDANSFTDSLSGDDYFAAPALELQGIAQIREKFLEKKAKQQKLDLQAENKKLKQQVIELQQQRFTEVEELVYLRWQNACLRFELRHSRNGGRQAVDQGNHNITTLDIH